VFDLTDLPLRALFLIPMILSLSVHEWAHAFAAFKLGDRTAEQEGRLTLNPLSHIDPVGTILLPLMGIPFGWAKPVPVNPVRFHRGVSMRTGMAITAFAGPLSNLVLAIGLSVLLGLWVRFGLGTAAGPMTLMLHGITLNLALALFNLLPIPPLDGSRIADRVMPRQFEGLWHRLQSLGPILLLALAYFASQLLAGPRMALQRVLMSLVGAIANV
jgi:Zn-dependent protease